MSGSTDTLKTKGEYVTRDSWVHVKWIQGQRRALWTDPVTSVVCLVISKQGATMFHYGSLPDADEVKDDPKSAHDIHAQLICDQITYFWNEDDDIITEITASEAMKLFLFLPDAPLLTDEHEAALNSLKDKLPPAMRTRDADPEESFIPVVSWYGHPKGCAAALIEVAHDGTDILPKVSLNGVRITPTVPKFN